ncbi:tail fiber protein [Xanthobacter sp. DSM 24535]|uniref:phage tail protein n=1 Tax=Roseixanthobacter psychrophilus TaxID=3119917 RepID=UPI00372B43CD
MSEYYVGEIRMFAGINPPRNWAFCNGPLLPIAGHEALFSLIGATYGGDGIQNFKLPQLNGRVPMGVGQGPSLTPRALAASFGVEQVTLALNEMPAHTHVLQASTDMGTSRTPDPTRMFATMPSSFKPYTNPPSSGTTTDDDFAAVAISDAGGNAPHSNIMPVLGINYIIALQGIFPSFS